MEQYKDEIWKPIKGYDGIYEVSNYGRIKSHKYKKERILKCYINNKGYCKIDLLKNGTEVKYLVHRLVAETFIPNPNNYPCINHKDEDKTNNFVYINPDGTVDFDKSNLEWCNYQYNDLYGTRTERILETKKRKGFIWKYK